MNEEQLEVIEIAKNHIAMWQDRQEKIFNTMKDDIILLGDRDVTDQVFDMLEDYVWNDFDFSLERAKKLYAESNED
jgi:hypothetical protein